MTCYGVLFPHIVHLQYSASQQNTGANVLSNPPSCPCHKSCVAKKNRRTASLPYHITHRNSAPSNLLLLPGFKDTSHQPYCATFCSTQSGGYLLLTVAVDITRIPIFPRQVGSF